MDLTSTGDLGKELLVGLTRVETKLDMNNDNQRRIEMRVDDHEIRIRAVEEKDKTDDSYTNGIKAGEKRILSWVSIAWGTAAAIAASVFTVIGGDLIRHFFG